MTVKIIQSDNVEEFETMLNDYLKDNTDVLINHIEILPRGTSSNVVCYAVLVKVNDDS